MRRQDDAHRRRGRLDPHLARGRRRRRGGGRPARRRTSGKKRAPTQPLERVRCVILNRACKDISCETSGPHSFQFKSPYPHEPAPAMRALDCRPMGTPGTGKKRVSSKDKGKTPREFVFGTDACDVWEVEYKDGEDVPTIGVQVHGHMADLHAVATHPADPNVFASAAEADRVFLWNASDRTLTRTAPAGLVARSAAFSVDPVRLDARLPRVAAVGDAEDGHQLQVQGGEGEGGAPPRHRRRKRRHRRAGRRHASAAREARRRGRRRRARRWTT